MSNPELQARAVELTNENLDLRVRVAGLMNEVADLQAEVEEMRLSVHAHKAQAEACYGAKVVELEAEVERLRSLPDNPAAVEAGVVVWKEAFTSNPDDLMKSILRAAVDAVGEEGK